MVRYFWNERRCYRQAAGLAAAALVTATAVGFLWVTSWLGIH